MTPYKATAAWAAGYFLSAFVVLALAHMFGVLDSHPTIVAVMTMLVAFKAGRDVEKQYLARPEYRHKAGR